MKKTLAIIGGGAVGLTSAIHAYNFSKGNINIIILEKMDRVGKKILATGNGRCNFTNIYATYENFYGEDKFFSKYFLEQFSVQDTIDFFYNLGVLHTVLENGKVYPYSEQASSILDALRNKIDNLNIPIKTEFDVKSINKKNDKFKIVSTKNETILANKIIFATGGMASQNLGSNGSGIKILKSLGHSCTKLTPALVQLKTPPEKVKSLKGIKITGNLKMYSNDTFLKEEYGQILFTDYGISGPPVFQLSTLFARYKNLIAYIDFMPSFTEEEVFNILKDRKKLLNYTNMENYFNGLLNKRLGNIIAKSSGSTTITAYVKGKQISTNVVVSNPQPARNTRASNHHNNSSFNNDDISYTVYKTKTGDCYHRSSCRYLSRSCIPISKNNAVSEGLRACSVCNP